jgi:hypothetical protein
MSEACDATFESGNTFLKHVSSGVHNAGIDVAELFEAEEFGGMFCITKHVAGGLINRDGA